MGIKEEVDKGRIIRNVLCLSRVLLNDYVFVKVII